MIKPCDSYPQQKLLAIGFTLRWLYFKMALLFKISYIAFQDCEYRKLNNTASYSECTITILILD